MGCLKLTYNENNDTLKVAYSLCKENQKYCTGSYRYGFNGKENDRETVGTGSGTQDYGFRIYNPSLGKFLSIDPISAKFPYYSPYHFAGNSPIMCLDMDGAEDISYLYKQDKEGSGYTKIATTDYRSVGGGSLGHGINVVMINSKGEIRKSFMPTNKYSTETPTLAQVIAKGLEGPGGKADKMLNKLKGHTQHELEGGNDGANIGRSDAKDKKVGAGIVAVEAAVFTLGTSLIATEAVGAFEVVTNVGAGVSLVNGADDVAAAFSDSNEAFSVSLLKSEKSKARMDNVKVAATYITLGVGIANFVKTPLDIINTVSTVNDAKSSEEPIRSAFDKKE